MGTTQERSTYIKSHPSWNVLKGWLSKVSFGKCWYCEAKSPRAPFDVDHFRPKLGITVDGKAVADNDGYYWMAYEWWNFRLSCQRCNRPEADETSKVFGKANEFPLINENTRCKDPNDFLGHEEPKLLDPCVEEDCNLLIDALDGEVKPSSEIGSWEYERARYTILQLGLNAFGCPENKRTLWQGLDILIRHGGNTPEIVDQLKLHIAEDHEYSSFYRSAIGIHRDKHWIAALL